MNYSDKKNKNKPTQKQGAKAPRLRAVQPRVTEPDIRQQTTYPRQNTPTINNKPQIISGYFVQEIPYREKTISRVNKTLYSILAILVVVCMASYYCVVTSELELNNLRKETLSLNYENEELRNELDRKQSYNNVDKVVSNKSNLKMASEIIKVQASSVPVVKQNKERRAKNTAWIYGY
ncbi:hypothetical protein IKA15_03135 [bacterium]|nr:hypothetical protein [bacterium]